jgi:hypothetical protein
LKGIRLQANELISGHVRDMPIGRLLGMFSSVPRFLTEAVKNPDQRISLKVKKVSLDDLFVHLHRELSKTN